MQFLTDHPMYVVLIIASLILIGVLLYLWYLDGRIARLERMDVVGGGPAERGSR